MDGPDGREIDEREPDRPITGHKTRSVFDRDDIVSEDDLADATRKLATGTIAGTKSEADALRDKIAQSVRGENWWRRAESKSTLRFSVIPSRHLMKTAETTQATNPRFL